MKKQIVYSLLVGVAALVLAGCAKTPGDIYVDQQTKAVKEGDRWAQFNLWESYYKGTNGVKSDPAKANKWLQEFVKGVYVVRFEPANGFHPATPGDFLKALSKAQSAKNGLGTGSFFRTTKDGNKLVGSFLTDQPDKLQALIEKNHYLKFISSEVMTPESFVEYEKSPQESIEMTGDVFISLQTEDAQGGNRWAQYSLWDAYNTGSNNVVKNPTEANKWLQEFVKGVYVVRFEAANGFQPKNAGDYLNNIRKHTPKVQSAEKGVGLGSFFRTKRSGSKLMASFLTDDPEKLKDYIKQNPDLRFISSEAMTPKSFADYVKTQQESL